MATRRSDETSSPVAAGARGAAAARAQSVRGKPAGAARPAAVSAESRRAMIAEAAYLRAERRGFAPGGETADWLAAEQEVDALLKLRHGGPAQ
ncbi:MAG TPA: DUF2934 domain-containing protein [Steroidobacteraceae bacterium]|nr:DUF2934 domain-containing protein [Steroidobacteraceae bacterium]